jgi:hypothetical protein
MRVDWTPDERAVLREHAVWLRAKYGVNVLERAGSPDPYIDVPDGQLAAVRAFVARCLGSTAKGDAGRPSIKVSTKTLLSIFERALERGAGSRATPSYGDIAKEAGVKRTWVTPIVKWAVKHKKEARWAIDMSEIPARFSTLVED